VSRGGSPPHDYADRRRRCDGLLRGGVARAKADMSTPPELRLAAGQLKQFHEVVEFEQFHEVVEEAGKKLDALANYLADNGNWLDKETHERLDDLTDEMAFLWADVHGRLDTFVAGADDAGEDVIRSLRAAWE
jgi:hypothetical protein